MFTHLSHLLMIFQKDLRLGQPMYFRKVNMCLSEKLNIQNKRGLTEMNTQIKKAESRSLVARILQLTIWQAGGALDKALLLIAAVAEYIFVMHIGVVIGWVIGLWAGNVYFDHFSPEDYSKVFVLTKRGFIPYAFTKNGAIIGIFVSIVVLAVINRRLFIKDVVSLYAKGVTNSKEVARRLGHSVWRVERTMRMMRVAQNKNESGITISGRIVRPRAQLF
jgi:hypothetical protein